MIFTETTRLRQLYLTPLVWEFMKNLQTLRKFSEIDIEKIEEITCTQEPLKDYLKSEELLLGKN